MSMHGSLAERAAAPPDPAQDVAESIGIGNLTDDISSALAADVEYRLREVIEVRKAEAHCTVHPLLNA